jgi:hypothetical protein
MLEYRNVMDRRTDKRANLNAVAALAIWSVAFLYSFCALVFAAYCVGLVKLELFNPTPVPAWVTPTIFGISFALATVVVRLTLRK